MISQRILRIKSVQKFMSFVIKFDAELKYAFVKIMNRVSVPSQPMLGLDEIKAIARLSSPNGDFLEYGAGGSTAYIAVRSKSLTTIESDAKFLKAVIKENLEYGNINFLHGDIGPTKSFGQPISLLSWKYRKKWPNYALLPWIADSCPRRYSSIFIDGRFRVACVLVTLIHNAVEEYEILIDDYYLRSEYFGVEKILKNPARIGNAALFSVKKSELNSREIEELLDSYTYDFR
jgi:hypothetical protein